MSCFYQGEVGKILCTTPPARCTRIGRSRSTADAVGLEYELFRCKTGGGRHRKFAARVDE